MPPPGFHKSVTRYKIEQILSPEHLREYEKLLRDPRMTVRKLHQWVLAHGYRVGHGAVARHRRRFDADVQAVRKTAMLAEHFADASRGGGLAVLSDATVARFQQVLLERLMRIDKADEPGAERSRDFSPKEWLELARTISESVSARRSLDTLRAEFEDRARRAAEAVDKATAKRRWSGVEISDKVRRILGVPLPGEPVPETTTVRSPFPAPSEN
jgi:hypothetical protein